MITVVSASPRRGSRSRGVAEMVERLLLKDLGQSDVGLLDLADAGVPDWVEDERRGHPSFRDAWAPVSALLHRSSGFVFVTPEWGGMVPPALKNLFLLCDGSAEFTDKPALIVGVSSGDGGAYVVAELRASSYKNTRVCYVPEQVLVRQADELFSGGRLLGSAAALRVEARTSHALELLLAYADALHRVRARGVRDREVFRFGM